MGITETCLSVVAANMAGSALPTHTAIGKSGLAYASGQTTLGSEFDRNAYTSADVSIGSEITFITDFSPTETSGLVLKEYGTFTTGSSMLNREVLTGSLVFTGEEELQVQQTFEFSISGA